MSTVAFMSEGADPGETKRMGEFCDARGEFGAGLELLEMLCLLRIESRTALQKSKSGTNTALATLHRISEQLRDIVEAPLTGCVGRRIAFLVHESRVSFMLE
jgi:hypothetical protein